MSLVLRLAFRISLVLFALRFAAAQDWITFVFVNAKIWTENPRQKEAEAIAIAGNRIAAVGSNEEILKLRQPGTHLVNVAGRRILPGFDDAHVHFYSGGANLSGPQLREAKSEEEFRNRLAGFAQQLPRDTWVTGGNWDQENWSRPRLPTRQLIDPVTKSWPVFVNRLDGHMSLANSVALRMAGIDRNTKDVPGGVIVRDAHGEPTGILKDAAQALVERIIPAPTQKQIRVAIEAAEAYANAQGVTSVQDMSASPEIFRAYQTLLRMGQLHVRISGHQPLVKWQRLADVGVLADFGSEYLHIGGVKGFADGSLGSTTALFFEPYVDAPSTAGITSAELANPEQMAKNIEGADVAGLQIAIHAIGDKANNTVLNMYEEAARRNGEHERRWRIEHAQHLLASDIPRFARLQVIASMQPYHCIDDGRWAENRIGRERAKTSYAWRSLLDAGVTLAFGSDWDVAPMSPILGIYAAATRRTLDGKHPNGWIPEQKISVEEAVRAYTMGSAYASFDDGIKGSLEPGKLADLIILSDDIFAIDPVKIADASVMLTMFDGKIVFGKVRDRSGLLIR